MKNSTNLRREILELRDQLSEAERRQKSDDIATMLLSLDEIKQSNRIFIYVHFRSEVETTGIITSLIALKKQVAVPITRVKEKRLEIIELKDPESELRPGYCDIPEPREDLVAKRSLAPEDLDLIILPGSVFDERGGRFGYGGGYYDRLLAQIPRAVRIALAFDLQVVEHLPLQDHDEILDKVVTEKRVIRVSGRI